MVDLYMTLRSNARFFFTWFQCFDAGVYCPTGSKKPTRVSRGYYTLPEDAAVDRVVGKVNTQVREMCLIVPVGCTLVTSTATLL
jgi:hypothetical protein